MESMTLAHRSDRQGIKSVLSSSKKRSNQGFQALPLLVSLMACFLTNPTLAQDKPLKTLTVTGRGVATIPTTAAEVQLGVEVQGKTATEVQQEVARRSAAVVDLLRSRKVEKLQTTGIRLNPIYSRDSETQRITSYSGSNLVSFQSPTEQTGTLLDEAVRAGATRIDSVSFTASDQAISDAQKQALRQATKDAQEQADTVLSTLNLTRQEVVGIAVNGATEPPYTPLLENRVASKTAGIATPLVNGEQEIQASVTLQISY